MRGRSLTALVLAATVAAVVAAGASRPGPVQRPTGVFAAAAPFPPLLGVVTERRRQQLVRVDPQTLRPRGGPRVDLGSEGCAPRSGGQACWQVPPWSFSPDGSRVAVARHERGEVRSLRVVDVARRRVAADVPIAGGAVGLVAWPARDRALAVQEVCCDEQQRLLVVDLTRRRVARRHPLGGTVRRVGRTPRELVLLVAPPRRIGPARLAVVDGAGAVRSVRLERISAGEQLVDDPDRHSLRRRLPGLAVDPAGRRAFVVDAGLVAEVDLATLAMCYHELTRSASLLARIRDWLDPAAHAKGIRGPTRSATWLGGGLLAVTGADEEWSTDAPGAAHVRVRPAGLGLVDTRDWSVRTIDAGATDLRVAGDLLLATGSSLDSASGESRSIGLAGYGLDGERRFALFGGREAWVEQVHDGRAYVGGGVRPDGRLAPLRIVELATGRAAGERAGRLPWLLLDAASGWWED